VPVASGDGAAALSRTAELALSGKFRIDRVIGMGGMGLVLQAHHIALDQRVALKLMRPEHRTDENLVRRFQREARAAARLTSPHAVRVTDVGALGDGTPYLVMEYLDGIDVATLLQRHGAVPFARAAAIVQQASRAVAETHRLGIIHRDLKPSNLFVVQAPNEELLVKVLDLGVCKLAAGADDLRSTSSAVTLGTPAYMAVEQMCSAHSADERSDIWSLGVILYELIEGVVPFRGCSVADQCLRAKLDPTPAMTARGVPPGLRAIVERCLQKDPGARYQAAAELTAALAPFAATSQPGSPSASLSPGWSLSSGRSPPLMPSPGGPLARRQWRWWGLSAALLVGIAGITSARMAKRDATHGSPALSGIIASPSLPPVTARASPDSAAVTSNLRPDGSARTLAPPAPAQALAPPAPVQARTPSVPAFPSEAAVISRAPSQAGVASRAAGTAARPGSRSIARGDLRSRPAVPQPSPDLIRAEPSSPHISAWSAARLDFDPLATPD
jgi:eukaryotic-like serine/threonine-protein kinase